MEALYQLSYSPWARGDASRWGNGFRTLGGRSSGTVAGDRRESFVGSLDGKRVVVTGAARGLGEEIARQVVSEGGRVLLVDVRDEAGSAVAASLGDAARYVHGDVTAEADWEAVMEAAVDHLGGVDGLVNNAAILWMGRLEDMSAAEARRVVDVNLIGTFLGIRSAIGPLRASGGGSIVNISSVDGLGGMNSVAMYSASKWGLRGLTRSAALELGRDGIRVNTVCPAMGNPEMSAPWFGEIDLDRFLHHVQQPALLDDGVAREVHSPDVARMVVFLLGDSSRTCSGADYPVDAAWTAGKHAPGLPGF